MPTIGKPCTGTDAAASTSPTSRSAQDPGQVSTRSRERGVRDAPGPTFVKTFLRTYSEVLGLDPSCSWRNTGSATRPATRWSTSSRWGRRTSPGTGAGADRGWGRAAAPAGTGGRGGCARGDRAAVGGRRRGGGDRAADTTAQTNTTPARRRRERPVPRRVVLRIAPITPTYVCVDRGPGTEVIRNTIAPQAFRGRRLRVNFEDRRGGGQERQAGADRAQPRADRAQLHCPHAAHSIRRAALRVT